MRNKEVGRRSLTFIFRIQSGANKLYFDKMAVPWTGFHDKDLEEFIKLEEKAFSNVHWSDLSLPLSKFVDDYTLPQIIQIMDGFYSDEDDSSLSSGQIMKVHCLKTISNVCGVDQAGESIHIPLNTPQKVLLRPADYDHVYETVNDLVRAKPTPKFVEIVRGYYDPTGAGAKSGQDLTIEAGEILEVIRTPEHPILSLLGKEKCVLFRNMKGAELSLPHDSKPGFKALLRKDACFLAEAVNERTFPFYASFVEKHSHFGRSNGKALSVLGVVKFEKVYKKDLIIASCGHWSVRVVFTIPKDIDVTIRVAEGTLTKDPGYAGLCQGYNNYKKIDVLAVKRYELDIHRNSQGVKGYEYHVRTPSEGEFVGLPLQEKQEGDSSSEDEEELEHVFHDREATEMLDQGFIDSDGKIVNLENFEIKGDDISPGQSSSMHERSSQDSYDLLKGAALYQPNDEHVKLIGVKVLSESIGKTEGPTNKKSYNIKDSKVVVHNQTTIKSQQPYLPQGGATSLPDAIREMSHSFSVPKPFTPQQKSRTRSLDQVHSQSITTKTTAACHMTNSMQSDDPLNDGAQNDGNQIYPTQNIGSQGPSDFKIPTDLSVLSTKGVCECLNMLNLNHLVEIFEVNQINGSLLISLDDEDYQDLSIQRFARKKLLKFVDGWRPDKY